MNTELLEALTILEKEKDISREVLLDAIEESLIKALRLRWIGKPVIIS